jgi:FAD/FMN-containing dehydrogenase
MVTAPPAPFIPADLHGQPVVVLAAGFVGSLAEGAQMLRPLREFAQPALDTFGPTPYTALQAMVDDSVPAGLGSYARSEWLAPLDDAGITALVEAAWQMTSPSSQVLLRIMGGAIGRVPPDATAFRYRYAAAMLTLNAMWPKPADPGHTHRGWAHQAWQQIRPWSAGGGYINHLCNEGPGRVHEAYGEQTWNRLVQLKRRHDPDNVFHLNQNIPPTGWRDAPNGLSHG